MNNQDQNTDTKNCKYSMAKTLGEMWAYTKKIPFILGSFLIIGGFSYFIGFISYNILLVPGDVYAAYRSDINTVRNVQLLLSLRGVKTENPMKIDGILGPITKEAIENYQKKHNLEITGTISERLSEKLYEDTKSFFIQAKSGTNKDNDSTEQETSDSKKIRLEEKLANLKENLRNTNNSVKSLVDNMPYHFITSYRDLVAIVGVSLGIVTALLGGFLAWGIPKLQKTITKNVENAHREMLYLTENRVSARVLTNFSAYCIFLYHNLDKETNPNQYNNYLDMAVSLANLAYDKARNLIGKDPLTDDDTKVIDGCLNNKIYYLIERGKDQDKDEAKKLLGRLEEIVSKQEKASDTNWWRTKETLLWARFKAGIGTENSAKEDMKGLLKSVKDPEWENYVYEKWGLDDVDE